MNIIRNRRHLVKGEGCLYAVSSSYPVVERYELGSEKLLETFDLSGIDCIGTIWSFIVRNTSSPKAFTFSCKMYIMQMESFTYYMRIGRTNTQSIIFWYWKQKVD